MSPRCRELFIGLALLATPLSAADLIVTRYDDPVPDSCSAADCSLREAVIAANADPNADRILLSAGLYELSLPGNDSAAQVGDLDLKEPVELIGPGATMTTIDGQAVDRVLEIAAANQFVAVRGVTITGGNAQFGNGGSGVLIVNTPALLEACEIRGDLANSTGSGVQVTNSIGVVIRNSTIAAWPGVGVQLFHSTLEIFDSTVTANGAAEIFAVSAPTGLSCAQCTIFDPSDAGAEVAAQSGATIEFTNSIVGGECDNGAITSLDGNLESPGTTCGFLLPNDQQGLANPGLGGLADNGGPTRTMLPVANGAAADSSSPAGCSSIDQRGIFRPQDGDSTPGSICDVGAAERATAGPPTPIFYDGFLQGGTEAWSDSQP